MQLTGLLPVVRRWWLVLLAATVMAGCLGFGVATLIAPTYEAEARLLVGPLNTDVNTLRASGQLARTYAEIATSEPLLASATSRMQSPRISPEDVEVQATADEVTRILSVRVRSTERRAVAPIANGLAEYLEDRVGSATVRPEGELQVVDAARPPEAPVAPRVPLTGALAAFAGLLVALTLVLVYEYLTPMARTTEQLERLRPGVDVIGAFPRMSGATRRSKGPAAHALSASPTVSTYALTSARLLGVAPGQQANVVLVLGAGPAGQASQVAVSLAGILVAQGRKPVLVEADRVSALTAVLGVDPGRPGLTDELAASTGEPVRLVRASVAGAINVGLLPFGTGRSAFVPPDAARALLDALRVHGDIIIVESAPIARDPDALVWAGLADATLLVVQRNRDRLDEVESAIDALRASGARLAGMVLDDTVIAPGERSATPSVVDATDEPGRVRADVDNR